MLIETLLAAVLLAAQQPLVTEAPPAPVGKAEEAPEPQCVAEVYAVRVADEIIADEARTRESQLQQKLSASDEARVHYAVGAMVVGIVAGAFIGGGIALFAKGVGGNAVAPP